MRTVFVIGAGANVEIGMPSGYELKMDIAKRFIIKQELQGGRYQTLNDGLIASALEEYFRAADRSIKDYERKNIFKIASIISAAMPFSISIDNFIETRRDDSRISIFGKIAIIRSILEAENTCPQFDSDTSKEKKMHSSWYPLFFQKITEGCQVNELELRLRDISFIIFNYDRYFEYFMYNMFMISYGMNRDMARDYVKHLHIIHPYGTAGDLWDKHNYLTFGKSPDSTELLELTHGIKTFTESTDQEANTKKNIQYLVERADRIIFLGFAYHDQNMKLLFDHRGITQDAIPLREHTSCYGTGYGISKNDLPHVQELIKNANKRIRDCNISGPDVTCAKFFKDFWYTLSFKEGIKN